MNSFRTSLIFSAAFLLLSSPVLAQQNSEQPMEITATKSVEWLRTDQKFVARENVVITQGAMTINATTATADYKETAKSSMDIWQLTAEGNVVIVNDGNTATGDLAVYDVEKGVATLTGQNLKIVSPDQTVTATEKMEYFTNTRQARAIGNAKVVRGEDTLSANTITATFKDDAASPQPQQNNPAGTGNLERIDADGNVVIVTPTETLRGSKGVYRADTNTAEITGNVKIQQGQNVLEGNRAVVDLTTNVSRIFGGGGGDGRVRGVFYPSSGKSAQPETPAAPNPAPLPAPAGPARVAP